MSWPAGAQALADPAISPPYLSPSISPSPPVSRERVAG